MPLTVIVPIKPAWGDMDAFGHINNVQYLRYFETARVRFFEVLFDQAWDYEQAAKPVVAQLSCQYKQPLSYPQSLELKVWVERLGNASMDMKCEMHNPELGLIAVGECTLVYLDFNKQMPVRIPDALREAIGGDR